MGKAGEFAPPCASALKHILRTLQAAQSLCVRLSGRAHVAGQHSLRVHGHMANHTFNSLQSLSALI
eukprot:1137842-Pelagomonas_calceolata.AAC.1